MKTSVYTQFGSFISPLGHGISEQVEKIKQGFSALACHTDTAFSDSAFYGARINSGQIEAAFNKTSYSGNFTRLEKMLLLAADPVVSSMSAADKSECGVIVSTTKGNIEALQRGPESDYFLSGMAQKVTRSLGFTSQAIVLSNACVSGIMAVSVAKRLIQAGAHKHVLILGGDTFSPFVFSGFQSFQAVSSIPCQPYDVNRSGISLGEAAAALLVSSNKEIFNSPSIYEIVGDSSINDANHISGPSRTGEGLFQSTQNAISEAGVAAKNIDCISAHGTATLYNDEMEAQAFNRAQLQNVPLYSLKGYFGHTLGAAGLLETVVGLRFANENLIPKSLGYETHGLSLPLEVAKSFLSKEICYFLKTASGFGGCNTAVLFKKIKA